MSATFREDTCNVLAQPLRGTGDESHFTREMLRSHESSIRQAAEKMWWEEMLPSQAGAERNIVHLQR